MINIFILGLIIWISTIIIFFLRKIKIKTLKIDELIKPFSDEKEYSIKILPNKIKTLLIHDNNTEISGCSLTVTTGSFNDIFERLAVLSSKLVFGGTKKKFK